MILREVKNIYIKNRLTEGVDFKRYEWLDSTKSNTTLIINESDFVALNVYKIGNSGTNIFRCYKEGYGNRLWSFSFESWSGFNGFAMYNPSGTYASTYANIQEYNREYLLTKNGDNIIYQGGKTVTLNYPTAKIVNVTASVNALRFKSLTTSTGRYLPCKLLQDIPASLSIDNKAYTANTCGLYYTTTGKFIGNSNLTVEGEVEPETHTGLQQIYQNKLIEGADYETADWLKGSVPLGTLMMSLPINSSNCNFTYIWGNSLGNMNVFSTNGFHYYNGNSKSPNLLMVYDLATAQNIYHKYGITQPTTVNASDDALMINNSIYPKYGFPITFIKFENVANGTSEGVKILSSIKVDGVTRYVPCTLLRSIPRNLDAQCKARVAGECGMIDLISGKFYGNVANSGTFTVENDTENNE